MLSKTLREWMEDAAESGLGTFDGNNTEEEAICTIALHANMALMDVGINEDDDNEIHTIFAEEYSVCVANVLDRLPPERRALIAAELVEIDDDGSSARGIEVLYEVRETVNKRRSE